MTKKLSKEIIARSKLRNNCIIDKTERNRFLYTQKRNKYVALLRNPKELLQEFRREERDG